MGSEMCIRDSSLTVSKRENHTIVSLILHILDGFLVQDALVEIIFADTQNHTAPITTLLSAYWARCYSDNEKLSNHL